MITLEQQLNKYRQQFEIVGEIDLDHWHDLANYQREPWLNDSLQALRRESYSNNQRILCVLSRGDDADNTIIKTLQYYINQVDITNCFVLLLTNQGNAHSIQQMLKAVSVDSTSVAVDTFDLPSKPETTTSLTPQGYKYNSSEPIKIILNSLSEREKFLLSESKTFCIYPWMHLHAYPTGEAHPCCHSEMALGQVGHCHKNTLKEIWNSPQQRQLRLNMLNEVPSAACGRCYEQEESGFFSGRKSANKHHGHHIDRVKNTGPDGHLDQFEMTYWDIRFSNLCNLRCRSCGHIFSSQWYQDQVKLAGPEWKKQHSVLKYAGRTETDMWEQLIPHLDYVEQIYFAGGEPLLMEEHYNILEELLRRGRTDVRLIYNTNFTHTDLKGRSVFEYWKQFQSVAVGASLDAQGLRAEYIRKGTDWAQVEQNRRDMLAVCPEVDFYISPTLSIMNALHLPDFHRDWVEKGLLKPQDLNVNILQHPPHYRIDIATNEYKQQIQHKYQQHLEWLRPLDKLQRATVGFESAIKFMNSTDNTNLIDQFWRKTYELDEIRNENILDIIPELRILQ